MSRLSYMQQYLRFKQIIKMQFLLCN